MVLFPFRHKEEIFLRSLLGDKSPVNAIKEVLLELGEKDPKVASLKPEEFTDMVFVKELDESGFIDALYKGKTK